MKRKVLEYKKPLQRQRIGKNQQVFMATRFVAARTVQAVKKATSEIIEGVGVKLESFMTGTTEQPDNMDDVQWRNYNLSVARAAQSNANEAKKRIDAQKYAEKMAKLSDEERERRMILPRSVWLITKRQ